LSRSGGLEEEAGGGRQHPDARRAEEEWPARPRCWCSSCSYRRCGFWCCSCRRCGRRGRRWCLGDVPTIMSHTLLFYAIRQAFEQYFGPHLLFHQQNVDFGLNIILLFTCFFLACLCHREIVHFECAQFIC